MSERFLRDGDGIRYTLRFLGGFGVSRGCMSVIEAMDGPNKGKFFRADIARGITEIHGEIHTNLDEASYERTPPWYRLSPEEKRALESCRKQT